MAEPATKDPSQCSKIIRPIVYEAKTGKNQRIAIRYDNAWRPIFWISVLQDGSVYAAPRVENIRSLLKDKKLLKGATSTIDLNKGEEITDPEILKGFKVSFHASGIVNVAGGRVFRPSMRTLEKQEQLCLMAFEHPSKYKPISQLRKQDATEDYPIAEDCPLFASVFVAPLADLDLIQIPSAVFQLNLVFRYKGLRNDGGVIIQAVLYHGPVGTWPSRSFIMIPTPAPVPETAA